MKIIKKQGFKLIDPAPEFIPFRIKKKPAQTFFRRVERAVPTGNKYQAFFKKKYSHHREMDIEELHDGESYAFYSFGKCGYELKIVEGYRLKPNWEEYKSAWVIPPSGKLRHKMPEFPTNWVTVILPNGMSMSVQPRSATSSYYRQ